MSFSPQDFPRVFQADIGRLYARVIWPALLELPVGDTSGRGTAGSMDEFLENAKAQTTALLADETRRGLALMIAALFERQIAWWISDCSIPMNAANGRHPSFSDQLSAAAVYGSMDLNAEKLSTRLIELHTLGNVVRHGDGRSLQALRKSSPHFWREADDARTAQTICIADTAFRDFIRAAVRFWGLADHEPGAVLAGPF